VSDIIIETVEEVTSIIQDGVPGPPGPIGPAGPTGPTGAAGVGVPTGGTAGQVLEKIDGTNYNTQWATPSGGGAVTSVNTYTGAVVLVKADLALGNVDNTSDANKPVSTAQQTALNLKADLASPTFTGTVSGIDKTMVGLGNVDNTSDANKPVSTAQQTALNLKADLASPTFTGTVSGIDKTMVGLGNVDNTSDANKPVSTAQQTALNLKEDLTNKDTDVTLAADSDTRYPSQKAIKAYVDTANTSPANTIKGNNTGSSAPTANLTATQTTAMLDIAVGDSGAGGTKGLVLAPAAKDAVKGKVLASDGTWSANFPGATPAEAVRAVGTWTVRNATEANQWIDVVYAPDLRLFCAIASSGTNRVMTSSDGVTWAPYAATQANLWTSVCWSPELRLFCAVSYDGANRVMTSPDGQTWTPQVAAAANQWYRVVWAAAIGKFCATSLNGTAGTRVMTSSDGVTWNSQAESNTQQWYSLDWSPQLNLFVAVSLGGFIMTSPDGVTWSDQTPPGGGQDWYDIAWSADLGIFAAVAITGTSRVMTSPDGITWTNRTAASAAAWRRIVWAKHLGLFVAVSSGGDIMTSFNGITWTTRTSPQANQWYGISWSDDYKMVVITGITGTNRVLNSTYIGGFETGGIVGPTGPTGPTGATGATGPANPNGSIPSETAAQTTQQTTTSASFVDIPGLSVSLTTTTAAKIFASLAAMTQATVGTTVGEFRVVIDAQNGTSMILSHINITELKAVSASLLSTSLAAGTYTVKAQYRETSGLGTLALNQGVLVAESMQASAPYTVSQATEYVEDWITLAVTGDLTWTSTVSGTGAANTSVTTSSTSNNRGIVQFSTGTTATGRAALGLGTTSQFFGGGVATFEMLINIPTLSTVTEEYILRLGFGDVVAGTDNVDGVYFEYNRLTSVNWLMKTANNSTRTTTTSATAVAAGAWLKLKAVINDNGTNVDYYVNGALIGSVTTNIPITVARVCAPTLAMVKSAGTTARTMLIDYFWFQQVFTTPR
jgi:hypothetical protein